MVMDGNYDYEAVRRWTKKIAIFEKRLVLVPVNHESHWLLAVIWMQKRKIEIWDSVGDSHLRSIGKFLQKYLKNEWEAKLDGLEVEWKDFRLKNRFRPRDKALQTDGSSCGVYVCLFARLLAENSSNDEKISIDDVNDFVDKISGKRDVAAQKFRKVIAVELWLKSTKDFRNVEHMDVD
jgi:Ulp1 family protease